MTRWLGYAGIFIITVFVLHSFLVVVTLLAGWVAPDSLLTFAGPITFVIEFALGAVITWLIVRPTAEPVINEEDHRRGEEILAEQHLQVQLAEQHRHDEERLKRLSADLAAWRHAREVRAFAAQALAELDDGDVTSAHGTSFREELTWALEYADSIDPLARKPVGAVEATEPAADQA